ncbi:hypothetical protein [Streptomyces sp. enrichment culture]|uniref:hypothetical protein n=1 Tax=Streptomyces sp. enrichment culture TaxID=1795815 RepID=UPI003F5726E2
MDESEQLSAGAGGAPRKLVPPPALCAFLLLLALLFAVSFAVGSAAGPVAPGMRPPADTTGGGGDGEDPHGGMRMHGSGH